jgi:hypothetical protein
VKERRQLLGVPDLAHLDRRSGTRAFGAFGRVAGDQLIRHDRIVEGLSQHRVDVAHGPRGQRPTGSAAFGQQRSVEAAECARAT